MRPLTTLSRSVPNAFSALHLTRSIVESQQESDHNITYGAELGEDVALTNLRHLMPCGHTGSGKGVFGASRVADAHRLGFKVFVLNLIEPEAIHYKYPSRGGFAKAAIRQGVQPKGIDNLTIYQPAFQYAGSTLPKKLPDWFKLFSIPINDFPVLNSESVSMMADRKATPIIDSIFDDMLEAMDPEDTVAEMFYFTNKALEEGYKDLGIEWKIADKRSETTLKSILYRTVKPRMLCPTSDEIAMTNDAFAKIAGNPDEVSVFNYTFLPTPQNNPRYVRFYTMWLLQKILNYLKEYGTTAPRIMVYIPEGQTILADEKGTTASSLVVQMQLVALVKLRRKLGLTMVIDTQDPNDLVQSLVMQCELLMFKGVHVNEKLLGAAKLPPTINEIENLGYDIKDLVTSPRDGVFQYISSDDYNVRHVRLPPFDTMGVRSATNAVGMDKVALMENPALWLPTAPHIQRIEREAQQHGRWVQAKIEAEAAEKAEQKEMGGW